MNQPTQPHPQSSASTDTPMQRTTAIIGLLLALFGGGVLLAHALLDTESETALAGGDGADIRQATAETVPAAARIVAAPTDKATRDRLEQLRAEVSYMGARIGSLSAEQEAASELAARVDALEARLAAQTAPPDTDTAARIDMLEQKLRALEAAAIEQAAAREEQAATLHAEYAALGARFVPGGVLIRLDAQTLGFAPGTAELSQGAAETLADVAALLARHPEQQALLRGHTDTSGNAEDNLRLSRARAEAVRDRLVALGVPATRLASEGAGSAEPIAENATCLGRRQNRRVDVLLRLPPPEVAGT